MRSVIVIGASGYLGSKVIESLQGRELKVYAIKNNNPVEPIEGVEVIEGGVVAVTAELLKEIQPDIIFHCGRPTYSRLKRFGRKIAARKAGILNHDLINNIKRSKIKTKLVFASGSLVYGNSDQYHDESSPPNPISYSKQYFKGELPILNDSGNDNFKVLTLRFPWLIGDGSWFNWFYLKNIQEKGKIPLFGNGNNHMSILNVFDAAYLMVEYGVSELGTGVYNVFSPDTLTQLEFVNYVAKVTNCQVVPYYELYPKLEKAALEAFTSNILLKTNYPHILEKHQFFGAEESVNSFIS